MTWSGWWWCGGAVVVPVTRRPGSAAVLCMAPGGPSCGPSEPARAAGGAVPCNGHVSFVKHL